MVRVAALAALLSFAGMIGRCACRNCQDENEFDGVCQVKLDAYDVDWNKFRVVLDVTCESVEDGSTLTSLPDCRSEISTGEVWSGIGWFHQVNFNDAYGVYQASEYGFVSPHGWVDSSWSSKVTGGGASCYEGDGYCRKRRRCSVSGRIYGWVNEINGDEKAHDWTAAMGEGEYRVVPWFNRRVKDWWKYQKDVSNCVVCQVVPCASFSCPNGMVYGRPVGTVGGSVVRRVTCEKQCSPGTFLTCTMKDGCKYQPVTDQQVAADGSGYRAWYQDNLKIGIDINVVPVGLLAPPIEDCYPCKYADKRTHVGVAVMTDVGQANKGFLGFYCPGGSMSPQDCPDNQVTKVDPATGRTSGCGCKNGMVYDAGSRECRPCRAGHFCVWRGMSPPVEAECALDFYAESGWDACKKCDTRRRCDAGQALTRCLPGCASGKCGVYQQHDSECVNCAECQQLSSLPDSVPCYKVSPIVGFA